MKNPISCLTTGKTWRKIMLQPSPQVSQSQRDAEQLAFSLIQQAKNESGQKVSPDQAELITQIYSQFHDLNADPEDLGSVADRLPELFGPEELCGILGCSGRDCSQCENLRRAVYDLTSGEV